MPKNNHPFGLVDGGPNFLPKQANVPDLDPLSESLRKLVINANGHDPPLGNDSVDLKDGWASIFLMRSSGNFDEHQS